MKRIRNDTPKMWKGCALLIAVACLLIAAGAGRAEAAVRIREAEYEGRGKVEVNFSTPVEYGNLKVIVRNEDGKKVSSEVIEMEADELEFRITNYKQGKAYTYKISGVRKRGDQKYVTLSGKIQLPKSSGNVPVKKIDYDSGDREVSFEFETRVKWKSPRVVITDGKKNYVRYIKEKDRDEIEVAVKKLKRGVTYQYMISGIRKNGAKSFTVIAGTFMP